MKFLFDHNLSPKLVRALANLYPGSAHVRDLSLHFADDQAVWDFAANHGFVIVSKDSDFHQFSFLYGAPPKVVFIRTGNCSTQEIETILRNYHSELTDFDKDEESALLVLE